ncbi:MAG: TIGR02206 family membrane protein [Bacilli bacterium]
MEPTLQNDFFSEGFFGYGEVGNFKPWSLAHFIPLILLCLGIFFLYFFRNKIKNNKHEETIRYVIAVTMLLFEMSYFWRLLYVGSGDSSKTNLLTKLPLQVCEWTCIIGSIMLMKKSNKLCDICFYTCLTAGLLPLLFPAVISTTGPMYFRYYQYWAEHIIPIWAVFYMVFVIGYRPKLINIYKPCIFLFILAVLASIANYYIPEADYLYLANNTSGLTITSWLPEKIFLKFLVLIVLFLSAFTLIYFIYRLIIFLFNKYNKNKMTPLANKE